MQAHPEKYGIDDAISTTGKRIWSLADDGIIRNSSLQKGFLNSSDELMGVEKASDELIAAVSKKGELL